MLIDQVNKPYSTFRIQSCQALSPCNVWFVWKTSVSRGEKPSYTHTWMQILNPSTSAKLVMTKLQDFFVALVNTDLLDDS